LPKISAESINSDRSAYTSPEGSHAPTPAFSPRSSQAATPAFSSPSGSSVISSRDDYFTDYSLTPLNQSHGGPRPSLAERRASSGSHRGYHTPPLAIHLPPRPTFNEAGEELVDQEERKGKAGAAGAAGGDDDETQTFNFNLGPAVDVLEQVASIEEAQQLQAVRAIKMRRKSNRALDVQLGFEMNGASAASASGCF
jgi:hypothetical protein